MHVLYYIFYVKDVYSLENRKLLFTSLGKGYVDAIAAHETSVQQYIKDYGAKIRILDEAILTTGIGVAFPENTDSELPEKLTEIFKEMRKDGSEEKILKKYLPETSGYLEVDKIENNCPDGRLKSSLSRRDCFCF